MEWLLLGGAIVVVALLAVLLAWRPLRRLGGDIQAERAKELFRLQRERLQAQFLPLAAATGKPRGLRWLECTFEGEVVFARERVNRQMVALEAVAIRFEAVEGSDMEALPSVANVRNASAVFFFQAGQWRTLGKAVFNLNPAEALQHFHRQYEPLVAEDSHPES
jgi:hypothetical protein